MTKRLWPTTVVMLTLLFTGCAVTDTPFDRTPGTGSSGGSGLIGPTWLLEELNGQPVVEGTFASLTFNDQGGLGGVGGCNVYGGDFTADGSQIDVDDSIVSTMMACDEPIMTQEFAFFEALKSASAFTIENTTLTLSDQDGSIVATFTAQSQDLAGTSWLVTAFNNGDEAVVSVLDGTAPAIDFGADGQVSGTAGCNRVVGGFTTAAGTIKFSPLATTQMFCAEPEGTMNQETRLLAALETAATYHIEGPRLEFRTADDAIAVQFTRV
ncbi:META domain-containing protein [Brooklawnia sp.]|uniref:META domain-containing protein n=1 Tax=Brooklawnia sp. TaxID=2699740 RepID=UPI00311F0C26